MKTPLSVRLFILFAVYTVLPFIEIPVVGLSLSAPLLYVLFLEVFLKARQKRRLGVKGWAGLAMLIGTGLFMSSIVNGFSSEGMNFGKSEAGILFYYFYWLFVFFTTVYLLALKPRVLPMTANMLAAAIVRDMLGIMKTKTCAAGLTVSLKFTDSGKLSGHDVLSDQKKTKTPWTNSVFLKLFQSSRTASPGGLSAAGHRLPLRHIPGQMIYETQWLRGGVMFYRMSVLNESCYSDDLFALTARGCGLGEDTYLSRRAGRAGKLLLLESEGIEHPGEALPCAYPIRPFRFGFASAYSRRLLNDDYRYPHKPFLRDRAALVYSYAGNIMISLGRLFLSPSLQRFNFFRGYFMGALRGMLVKPTARKLSPGISWFKDADSDLLKGGLRC